jgi:signal transduction histidine kinase
MVTLVHIKGAGALGAALLEQVSDAATNIIEADKESVASELVDARDRGTVICVAPKDRHVAVLAAGADEAVTPDVGKDELRDALARAGARARWRETNRDVHSPELGGLTLMGAALGHEIRNSLASAYINSSTLETLVGRITDDTEVHETISDINAALRNITEIANTMLSVIREDDAPGSCDLAKTLIELTTYLHREMVRVADFEAEIPEEPCHVPLTRIRMLEVVASVLNNATIAVENLTERKPRITLRVTREREAQVVVEVTDNGVGMSAEVQKEALNPFFTTRRPGALGLGLTFAATTVRRAGGEILIDSRVGVGTTVRLFLPRLAKLGGVMASRGLN